MKIRGKFIKSGQSGQSMVEFAIVFPVLFLLFLTVIQTALLMTAKQIVNYAAFCAARAAIVEYNDEKIKRAARIACIPIAPKYDVSAFAEYTVTIPAIVGTVGNLLGISKDVFPGFDILSRIADLASVSTLKVEASLLVIENFFPGLEMWDLSSRYPSAYILTGATTTPVRNGQDVTVEVTHYYAMRIPIINKIFYYMYIKFLLPEKIANLLNTMRMPRTLIDPIIDDITAAFGALVSSTDMPLYLMPIRASCTLTMEREISGSCYGKNCD